MRMRRRGRKRRKKRKGEKEEVRSCNERSDYKQWRQQRTLLMTKAKDSLLLFWWSRRVYVWTGSETRKQKHITWCTASATYFTHGHVTRVIRTISMDKWLTNRWPTLFILFLPPHLFIHNSFILSLSPSPSPPLSFSSLPFYSNSLPLFIFPSRKVCHSYIQIDLMDGKFVTRLTYFLQGAFVLSYVGWRTFLSFVLCLAREKRRRKNRSYSEIHPSYTCVTFVTPHIHSSSQLVWRNSS